MHQDTSEANGRFLIGGLRKGRRYAITAGGKGLVSVREGRSQDRTVVAGTPETIKLVVAPLYAVAIRVTEKSGERLATSEYLSFAPTLSGMAEAGLRVYFEGNSLELSGVFIPAEFRRRAVDRNFWLFTANSVESRLGPLTFETQAPGYDRMQTMVWAARMTPSELVVQEVRLQRRAGVGFGDLRVVLPEAMAQPDLPRQRLGLLYLTPSGWSLGGDAYLMGQIRLPAAMVAFRGIPAGEYEVSLVQSLARLAEPAPRITVRTGAEVEWRIHLEPWGSLEIDPQIGSPGQRFNPVLNVDVRFGNKYRASLAYRLRRRPYRIVGITPGSYEVMVVARGFERFEQELQVNENTSTLLPAPLERTK